MKCDTCGQNMAKRAEWDYNLKLCKKCIRLAEYERIEEVRNNSWDMDEKDLPKLPELF